MSEDAEKLDAADARATKREQPPDGGAQDRIKYKRVTLDGRVPTNNDRTSPDEAPADDGDTNMSGNDNRAGDEVRKTAVAECIDKGAVIAASVVENDDDPEKTVKLLAGLLARPSTKQENSMESDLINAGKVDVSFGGDVLGRANEFDGTVEDTRPTEEDDKLSAGLVQALEAAKFFGDGEEGGDEGDEGGSEEGGDDEEEGGEEDEEGDGGDEGDGEEGAAAEEAGDTKRTAEWAIQYMALNIDSSNRKKKGSKQSQDEMAEEIARRARQMLTKMGLTPDALGDVEEIATNLLKILDMDSQENAMNSGQFSVLPETMQDQLKKLWGAVGNEEEVMEEEADSDEEGIDWDEVWDEVWEEETSLRGEEEPDFEESDSEESDLD